MEENNKNVRKKKNYKRTVVRVQIGLITFAIFLLLMVGAAVLTRIYENSMEDKGEQAVQQAADDPAGQLIGEPMEKEEPVQQESEDALDEQTEPEDQEPAEPAETEETEETAEGSEEGPDVIEPAEIKEITVSAIGDCVIGTDVYFPEESNFDAFYIVKKRPEYFFEKVAPVLAEDDLTIANMAGALTNSGQREEKNAAFRGKPEYTSVLTSGSVEAVDLANDHSGDYGQQGYEDTIANLEGAGITTFGFDRTSVMDIDGIKVGLVGVYELAEGVAKQDEMIQLIQSVKDQGAQLVIVSFHWGVRGEEQPTDSQKQLAHAAVDNGADLVLGHHPSVLQGIETYQGKKIVYSLGKFCYGGDRNPMDRDTMIYRQKFTFENGELVQDENVEIIPCLISSEKGYNSYQPVLAQGQTAERILQRVQDLSSSLVQ